MDKTKHRTLARVLWVFYLATMSLASLVFAEGNNTGNGVWTPTINPAPVEDMIIKAGVWSVRIGAMLLAGFALWKIVQGRVEAGTGISGIASRGHVNVYEAFTMILFFGLALVLLPFFIWILAQAGILPSYVAQLMSDIYRNVWNPNF